MCRAEAPAVEQFAQTHADEVTVIGLGTQDSLGEAVDFVDTYDTTFTMLWDESFQSWFELGVTSQPTAVFVSPEGEVITGWIGGFPEDTVLELAAEHAT